jgi:hypothetical protein
LVFEELFLLQFELNFHIVDVREGKGVNLANVGLTLNSEHSFDFGRLLVPVLVLGFELLRII